MTRWATSVLACVLAAGACGEDGPGRDAQLRSLLMLEDAVELDAPTAERLEAVARLEALHLSDPELRRTRQACVEGHRALVEGEQAQVEAQRSLAEVSGDGVDGLIPRARREAIESAIARSSGAIEEAGPLLRDCRQAIDGMELDLARR